MGKNFKLYSKHLIWTILLFIMVIYYYYLSAQITYLSRIYFTYFTEGYFLQIGFYFILGLTLGIIGKLPFNKTAKLRLDKVKFIVFFIPFFALLLYQVLYFFLYEILHPYNHQALLNTKQIFALIAGYFLVLSFHVKEDS